MWITRLWWAFSWQAKLAIYTVLHTCISLFRVVGLHWWLHLKKDTSILWACSWIMVHMSIYKIRYPQKSCKCVCVHVLFAEYFYCAGTMGTIGLSLGCACMYYVCTGLWYGFTHSLLTFLAHSAHDVFAKATYWGRGLREIKDSRPENEPRYKRQLTAQQRDERWQDNSDRRQLACQHLCNYFARWPVNRIGRGQHGVVSTTLRHFVWLNLPRAQREAHDAHAYS